MRKIYVASPDLDDNAASVCKMLTSAYVYQAMSYQELVLYIECDLVANGSGCGGVPW